MSAQFFTSDSIREYEIMLLAHLLRDEGILKLGMAHLNQVKVEGRKTTRNQDFMFPIHNLIWEKCLEAYLVSGGRMLPSMDVLMFYVSRAVADGTLSPFELEPAVTIVKQVFFMSLCAPYIEGSFGLYLRYVRIQQVEGRKQQGGYSTAEEYMAAYHTAMASSSIDNVKTKGIFPFMDLSMPTVECQRFPTGVRGLDDAMQGGLGRGEVGIFVAVSGGGKTIALNQTALSCGFQYGFKAFIGTCELVPDRMRRRLYSAATTQNYDEFKGRKPNMSPDTVAKLANFAGMHQDSIFIRDYVLEPCSVALLDRDLTELKEKHNWVPDVVIIDYLDKIIPAVRYPNQVRMEYKETVDALVRLAVKWDIGVWTATQSNAKGVRKKILDMTNASEAYSKVWGADVVIGVSDLQDEDGLPVARQWLHTAKLRDGAKVSIEVIRDFARQRFVDKDVFERLASPLALQKHQVTLPAHVPVSQPVQ